MKDNKEVNRLLEKMKNTAPELHSDMKLALTSYLQCAIDTKKIITEVFDKTISLYESQLAALESPNGRNH